MGPQRLHEDWPAVAYFASFENIFLCSQPLMWVLRVSFGGGIALNLFF